VSYEILAGTYKGASDDSPLRSHSTGCAPHVIRDVSSPATTTLPSARCRTPGAQSARTPGSRRADRPVAPSSPLSRPGENCSPHQWRQVDVRGECAGFASDGQPGRAVRALRTDRCQPRAERSTARVPAGGATRTPRRHLFDRRAEDGVPRGIVRNQPSTEREEAEVVGPRATGSVARPLSPSGRHRGHWRERPQR